MKSKMKKLLRMVIGIPALLFGVTGLIISLVGLGFVFVGKYIALFASDDE